MRKLILTLLLSISMAAGMAKRTTTVTASMGCYEAYLMAWSGFYDQLYSDMSGCVFNLAMTWYDASTSSTISDHIQTAVGAAMNADCAYSALNRYNTNVDNAANALFACNGLAVTP